MKKRSTLNPDDEFPNNSGMKTIRVYVPTPGFNERKAWRFQRRLSKLMDKGFERGWLGYNDDGDLTDVEGGHYEDRPNPNYVEVKRPEPYRGPFIEPYGDPNVSPFSTSSAGTVASNG